MDLFKTKEITLTRGKIALVDCEDFEWLNQWKWLYDGKCASRMLHLGTKGSKQEQKHLLMHRVILEKYSLLKDNLETDHINRDPLDNRKVNLRVVTHRENAINRGLHKNNKSGFKGVIWDDTTTNKYKKWQARIHLDGRFVNLGRFLTKEEAAFVYNQAAKKHFGEFAYLNELGGQFGSL